MTSYESLFAATQDAGQDIIDEFGDETEPSSKRARSSYTLIVGPKVSPLSLFYQAETQI